ncbi:MAG: insulinase family protein [Phycisphaerae bacterium]|nr:insulinase family protein [Phycisphaerae bacterium]
MHTRFGVHSGLVGLRRLIAAVAVLWLAALARAQDISFEKYQLPNGMTVILRQDRTLPVAAVNLWYRVGAREEPPRRSGFAHLFEHLMFMGTARVPGNDFDVLMESGGGANNASTSLDRTNYFSSGPASLLPTLLWLDADRLEDLGRTMTEEKLNKQRDVVRNEIRQNVENRPYGRAEERMYRLMYPAGHPYHEAVYGTHEDLEAATVNDVRDFFATFYVPRNCTLAVVGDFDPATIKPMIERLFGTIPSGAPVQRRTAEPARLRGVVRETMLDKVQLPLVSMAWHSPAEFAPGDAEMDLVAAVLSSGKNSRLYQRLVVKEKLAAEVSASQESAGLGSMFTVQVFARPEADLNRVEAIVDEELARLAKDGPTAGELAERQAVIEMGKLSRLQSVEAVADALNEYEYHYGDPGGFTRDLDRYRKATVAGVRDAAARVLDPNARAIITVLPEAPERTAKSARDTRPEDAPMPAFAPAAPVEFVLANGTRALLWRKPELPLVGVQVMFQPGRPLSDSGKAGVASLAAAMLTEGAGERDSAAFASAVQSLGARISAGADHEVLTVSMQTLKRTFGDAAGLLADAIRRPRMAPADFERVKRLRMDQLRQEDEEPTIVAARVGLRVLFGDENPYGMPTAGTLPTVEPLTLDDVRRTHAAIVTPESATVLIAGDVTAEEAKAALDKALGDWRGSGRAGSAEHEDYSAKPASGLRVVVVDRPEAVQTVIRFMAPAPRYASEERVPMRLINTILGGSFTSRLNQNLREDHGYTYGAGSRFVMGPANGYFIASSSVKASVTGAALKEFLAEFARLRGGAIAAAGGSGDIAEAEVGKARETLRTDTIQAFQGLSGLLGVAGELQRNGVPFATLAQDLSRMGTLGAKDLNARARAAVALERGVLVLVGDKGLIEKEMAGLGLPAAVEVDPLGTPKDTGSGGW